jgi:hypothetical protein
VKATATRTVKATATTAKAAKATATATGNNWPNALWRDRGWERELDSESGDLCTSHQGKFSYFSLSPDWLPMLSLSLFNTLLLLFLAAATKTLLSIWMELVCCYSKILQYLSLVVTFQHLQPCS